MFVTLPLTSLNMSGQLQRRNCRNRYDTRQGLRTISSPGSEMNLTRRGPRLPTSNTRSSNLGSLSCPQPSKLPVKTVNKTERKQSQQKPARSASQSQPPIDKPHSKALNKKGKKQDQTNLVSQPSPVHTDSVHPCIITPSDDNATDLSQTQTRSSEEGSAQLGYTQVENNHDSSPATTTEVTNLNTGNSSRESTSSNPSIDVEQSVKSPLVKPLIRSASDPCIHKPSGRAPCLHLGTFDSDQQNHDQFLAFLESNPSAPWHMTFQQLRTVGTKLSQLDTIQETTNTLQSQMSQVLGRTTTLENHVKHNDSEIEALKKDISALKQTVSLQMILFSSSSRLKTTGKLKLTSNSQH